MSESIQYIDRNTKLVSTFNKFKKKYQPLYPKRAWEFIENEFYRGMKSYRIPDILMQVYSELGLTNKGSSFYKKHLQLIRSLFPLDGNILEVGSGYIPALANLIANEQLKIGKGTITIYEPLLVDMTPKYPNMILNKKYFNKTVDVSQYDLIIGILPCEVTKTIIESACINKKDFYVALCGCVHIPDEIYYALFGATELYQQDIIEKTQALVSEHNNGILEITKLKNSQIPYPILYNRR